MTIGLIKIPEAQAVIGAVHCITCDTETIPMSDGTCGFCDRDPATGFLSEARARYRANELRKAQLLRRSRANSAAYRQRRQP